MPQLDVHLNWLYPCSTFLRGGYGNWQETFPPTLDSAIPVFLYNGPNISWSYDSIVSLRGYSILVENGPKLTPDDEMDNKVVHSLDPFLSRLSRTNFKPLYIFPAFRTYNEYGPPIIPPWG